MELNNSLVIASLYEHFSFIIFTRDKKMIPIIHCKQTFTLNKTSVGEK